MNRKDGDINEHELVLAECKHMAHPILIDGDQCLRAPTLSS